jgi:hypothetical protein
MKTTEDRLAEIQAQLRNVQKQSVRSEVTGGIQSALWNELPAAYQVGRVYVVTDILQGVLFLDMGSDLGFLPIGMLPNLTVAELQSSSNVPTGAMALATNGRRTGELGEHGSGCPVWFDGVVWRTFYDNSEVLA